MKTLKRRGFIKFITAIPVLGYIVSCRKNSKLHDLASKAYLTKDPNAMVLSKAMTRDEVFSMLDQRVSLVMEKSNNCAQSTFFALSEQFGLGGDDILKALTPLPGIAERGETCGAITGGLMAMGLVYGREKMDDWQKYRSSLVHANKFCQRFEDELGTTQCCQIQELAFGKSYNLMDPEELKEFQRAGATAKCTKVVQKACRIAAGIILDSKEST